MDVCVLLVRREERLGIPLNFPQQRIPQPNVSIVPKLRSPAVEMGEPAGRVRFQNGLLAAMVQVSKSRTSLEAVTRAIDL